MENGGCLSNPATYDVAVQGFLEGDRFEFYMSDRFLKETDVLKDKILLSWL